MSYEVSRDASTLHLNFNDFDSIYPNVRSNLTLAGNGSEDMDFLNKLISKWMPPDSKCVAVDSHPRLSGIMDTINSTLAHGQPTRLPAEFYNKRGRDIIDKIGVEEWFSGYAESEEYRTLGIGHLVGDIVSRMVGSAEHNTNDGLLEVGGDLGSLSSGRGGEKHLKFAMSGCHDTTLGGVLASLGAFEAEEWPPYTSHVALEMFRRSDMPQTEVDSTARRTSFVKETKYKDASVIEETRVNDSTTRKESFWSSLFGAAKQKVGADPPAPKGIARRPIDQLNAKERKRLDGYFVRIRYNDRPMTIPGCRVPGKHLEGDESFCTLVLFELSVV